MVSDNPEIVFSVIVPTYNRPQALSCCLEALAKLDYKRESFEVIVVDDGGDVLLESVIRPFEEKISLKLIRQQNTGPAAARNAGARQAQGRFLGFIDDDCRPSPDWLTSLLLRLTEWPVSMIGGYCVNMPNENVYSAANQLIRDLVYSFYNADKVNARFLASNNLALSADLFRKLGGFDPSFRISEDRDFCDRWLNEGYRMVYAPEAVVYHSQGLTFGTYWRLYTSYGWGAFQYNRAHALRNRFDSTLKPNFYFYIIRQLPAVLSGMSFRRSLALVFLLEMWFLANMLGFALAAIRYLGIKIKRIVKK